MGWEEGLKKKEEYVISRVARTMHVQERFYKEKVRNKWLELRDNALVIFIWRLQWKHLKNIYAMWIEGDLVVEEEDIIDHVVAYYTDLFRWRPIVDNNLVEEVIQSAICVQQNHTLISMPDEKEIYEVKCQMSANSAPGPDGFSGGFYKSWWSVIKKT